MRMRFTRLAILAAIGAAAMPGAATAQVLPGASRYAVSFSYGIFDYDLSGTGKSRMIAARVERPLSKYVLGEVGIAYSHPLLRSGEKTHYFIPELQVQAQLPLMVIAPYLGLGGGVAWDTRDRQRSVQDTRPTWDPTISVSAGTRAWLTSIFGARAELRIRGIGGEFQGSSTEWTIGAILKL
jgi:hypothetical protein